MARRDLVVIGASAGGIEALQQLLTALPTKLDAAVLIMLHTSRHAGRLLPEILQRASRLKVLYPQDNTPVEKRKVYFAPPDHPMLVEDGRVIQGPRENTGRRSIRCSGPQPRTTAPA